MSVFTALQDVFFGEWATLTHSQRLLVQADYQSAAQEGRCSTAEYQRRIGRGNLASYVAVLEVNARKGGAK